MTTISDPSIGELARAAEILRQGGLVAFPTETVYGLGANALEVEAVARVFEVKGRPLFDPLIVHVAGTNEVAPIVRRFPKIAQTLAAQFWPGPLTLVLPKSLLVPDLVTAGCPTIAVRVPDHPVALELLRLAGVPLAAPSANLFGRISPTTAAHVREQLGESIDLILDGGPCRVGVESTVLQLTEDQPILLRPGGTPIEEIESLIGPVSVPSPVACEPTKPGLTSPGTLPQHYAPRTPLAIVRERATVPGLNETDANAGSPSRIGLLAFTSPSDVGRFEAVEVLSAAGDLREATTRFFAALRRLDAAGLDLIVAETFPERGLGRALNDRLRRAEHG
ncbi:MAG TPA: L-threonylcarbamoyladenylate synthase [Planctomycetaceae bacterium]|nr:L-threonylcarbamoyladenylate synthase [Planctomycetaceae bacterium]